MNGLPDAVEILAQAPQIADYASFYWDAYKDLITDRPQSMSGMAPIPVGAILQYADHLEMTRRERDLFIEIIRTLDNRNCVLVTDKMNRSAIKK